MDLNKFSECLKIVDSIIDEGGYDTVRVYLASVMADSEGAYENVLNSKLDGKKVKEVIKM